MEAGRALSHDLHSRRQRNKMTGTESPTGTWPVIESGTRGAAFDPDAISESAHDDSGKHTRGKWNRDR